jgi:type IV pilus assembly protein PilA
MGIRASSQVRRDLACEQGFTLIELMVVVLIISILIAIALPTYMGARAQAANRAIQSNMRTGLAAAMSYYAEHEDWDGFDAAQAQREESRVAWVDGPTAPVEGQVEIHVHAGQDLLLIGLSQSGTYYCLAQVAGAPATIRGQGPTFASVNTTASCSGGW